MGRSRTASSTPRPAGTTPGGCSTTTRSKPEDRVAGLLVLLYAQWPPRSADSPSTTSTPAATASSSASARVPSCCPSRCRLGLASSSRPVAASAAIGDPGASPWLFPGGQPGRPISADQTRRATPPTRTPTRQDRSTALFQLATDLPAAILARMLGIHITVAVAWQRASAGDWTDYAAEISRRSPAPDPQWDRHSDSSDIRLCH